MANADTSAQPVLAAARFGRRSSRGVLFGLSRLRLATVAGAFVIGASPVWGSALLVAYVSVQGPLAGGVGTGGGEVVVAQGAWAAPLSDAPDEAPSSRHVGPAWRYGPVAGAGR